MINLTNKERMYLDELKIHEEMCIQKYLEYAGRASTMELKQVFNSNMEQEREHLDTLNEMLNGQIPEMIQQQQQQQGQQQNQQQNQASTQNSAQNGNNQMQSQTGNYNQNDYNLCMDALSTEKYVSSTYNTSIFEFTVPEFRQALNHIQKEEQEHGEAIYNYMRNNGMYNAQ